MRILHLFANYKWTGPADPAIRSADWLRRAGADVVFAQAEWTLPGAEHRMKKELKKRRMPVLAGLELRKHFRVPALLRDVRALRTRLARGEFDVVHAHLLGDHLLAALAARRSGARRPVVVRNYYEPSAPSKIGWREHVALRATDGVVAPTAACAEQLVSRFGLSKERVLVQDPPIEAIPCVDGDLRAEWGLTPRHFLIGITARIQPHRRFELLWEAMRRVVDARPHARLVLLGRGNEKDTEELVRRPIERLGLTEHVLLPGYLYEPDYTRALASLDAFVFLVPGSDGTCRAVREAFAHGLPVVATRRGILPDLLGPGAADRGPCGRLVDETPDAFASALVDWIDDPESARALGRAARSRAENAMDPAAAAHRLLEFYRQLSDRKRDA